MKSSFITTFAILFSSASVLGHTWSEDVRLIAKDGSFTGPVGYARGFVARGEGDPDKAMVQLLPRDGLGLCKKATLAPYPAKFPQLSAASGDMIALRYSENGHVTKDVGKAASRPNAGGIVFVYGTKQPKENEQAADVHRVWNVAGTGGDKRGRLLATRPYDDGECYQTNSEPISQERQKEFPRQGEGGGDLVCQTDIQMPADAGTSGDYTLYWVWEWPLLNAAGEVQAPETYTQCVDIKMVASSSAAGVSADSFKAGQPGNTHAIKAQIAKQLMIDPSAKPSFEPAPAFDGQVPQPAPQQPNPQQPSQSSSRTRSRGATQSAPQATATAPSQNPQQPPAGNDRFVTVTVTASPVPAPTKDAEKIVTVTTTDYITVTALPSSFVTVSKPATAPPIISASQPAPANPAPTQVPSPNPTGPANIEPTGPPANRRPFDPAPPAASPQNGNTVYGRFMRRGAKYARRSLHV